jgi:hypothetical protein
VPPSSRRLRAVPVIGSALVLALAAIGYLVFGSPRHTSPPAPPPPPGCQAGTGETSIPLDTDQAGIAATIAGIAARHRLPQRAVTIALAAALQESQLQNLDYGDRDSVGVFQQRPSQGWGTTAELEDPVYATTKFFAALVRLPGYTKMPVDQAAQDVQHSADGSAYGQYDYLAGQLSGYFTGSPPRAVWCWYTPTATQRADVSVAKRGLQATLGPVRVTTDRSAKMVVSAQRAEGWTVAIWLVTHAQQYQISYVQYAGYQWKAETGSMGWQRDPSSATGSIVAG